VAGALTAMKRRSWLAVVAGAILGACAKREPLPSKPYAPLAYAELHTKVHNVEATIPPQCYARVGAKRNTCWTCHTKGVGPNTLTDLPLQTGYTFSDFARQNHFTNLLTPPPQLPLTDDQVLQAIRIDNYNALRTALRGATFEGFVPDLDLDKGFDDDGFARDGSGWRAVRYKPFPGAFFPTNGSAGDVYVRLPKSFGSGATLLQNYDILEAAITDKPIPAVYVGTAIRVERLLLPVGIEILHTVRYLDPDAPTLLSRRMKEVRYARKVHSLDQWGRLRAYEKEADEKSEGKVPFFPGAPSVGLKNDFGWQFQGWIEDADGRLRLQTAEEHRYCMGCHSGIGVTVDSTFSLARKVPGRDGFRPQDLRGIKDVPQVGHEDPEVLEYFARAGGGDDFGSNTEVLEKFFPGGVLDAALVRRAAKGGDRDLTFLIVPSRARAIALDRGYLSIVRTQRFDLGRDGRAVNIHAKIEIETTGAAEFSDGRLHLEW